MSTLCLGNARGWSDNGTIEWIDPGISWQGIHTLPAILNRGGATAKDILALKEQIEKTVFDIWGVSLQPEPVFVGF